MSLKIDTARTKSFSFSHVSAIQEINLDSICFAKCKHAFGGCLLWGPNSSSVGCTQFALYPALCLFQGLYFARKSQGLLSCWPNSCFLCLKRNWPNQRFQSCVPVDVLLSSCQEPRALDKQRDKKSCQMLLCSFFDQSCCKKWQEFGSFLCVDVKQVVFLLAQIGTVRFWSRFTVASIYKSLRGWASKEILTHKACGILLHVLVLHSISEYF